MITPSKKTPAPTRTAPVDLARANGLLKSLCVGVSEYSPLSGFKRLKACANDAERVRNAFLDVPQLAADKGNTYLISEKTAEKPTKNTIIGRLKHLTKLATPEDRLLFFFSGHAVRLENELYLVPSDAYAGDDKEILIPIALVKDIISNSEARQKFIILDACYSGPDLSQFKTVPLDISNNFVKKYVKETEGVALLSSSSDDEMSTVQSPDKNVSLFTYFLLLALYGDSAALDANGQLTLFSLVSFVSPRVDHQARDYQTRQRPALDTNTNGDFLLGDFAASPVALQGVELDQFPISSIAFDDSERARIKDILTRLQSTSFHQEQYLEKRANDALPEYLQEDFGQKAAALVNQFGFAHSAVSVQGVVLEFPDGALEAKYESDGKNSGRILYTLDFQGVWMKDPSRILQALRALNFRPDTMRLVMSGSLDLDRMKSGLPARGWRLSSILPNEIAATRDGFTLTATETELEWSGLLPKDIFGDDADEQKTALMTNVLGLLSA
jgi:hypothetical protein